MANFVTLEELGKSFIPQRIRPKLRKYLVKAGYTKVPYKSYGLLFMLTVLFTAFVYIFILYPSLSTFSQGVFMILTFSLWFIVQLLLILFIIVFIYIYLDLRIYRRTKEMEDHLEEYLRYVSENLKGGMLFEKALWEAMRPQFLSLTDEIGLVAKKVMTGTDVSDALSEFIHKYDSPIIKRSFQLIIEGMKGGGQLAYIIDRVEKDIRETKDLRAELKSANTTYIIFLIAIVLIIAPALFGLSYNLLIVLDSIAGNLGDTAASGISAFNFGEISVDEDSFNQFAIGALLVVSLFGSMIISIIQKGNIKSGIKFIPIFMAASVLVYLLLRSAFELIFSGMMGF